MSYCRWSSDDFKSDFYIWEDVGGFWAVSLADSRYTVNPDTRPRETDFFEWAETHIAPIGLPHAGETFQCPSPGEAADKCEELAALGYHLPDWVVAELRAEQAQMDVGEMLEATTPDQPATT